MKKNDEPRLKGISSSRCIYDEMSVFFSRPRPDNTPAPQDLHTSRARLETAGKIIAADKIDIGPVTTVDSLVLDRVREALIDRLGGDR